MARARWSRASWAASSLPQSCVGTQPKALLSKESSTLGLHTPSTATSSTSSSSPTIPAPLLVRRSRCGAINAWREEQNCAFHRCSMRLTAMKPASQALAHPYEARTPALSCSAKCLLSSTAHTCGKWKLVSHQALAPRTLPRSMGSLNFFTNLRRISRRGHEPRTWHGCPAAPAARSP